MLYLFNNGKGGTALFSSVQDIVVRHSGHGDKSELDPDAPFVAIIDGCPLPAYTGHSVQAFTDSGEEVTVFDYQGAL